MRFVLLAALTSCVPAGVTQLAGDRLGVHHKSLHLVDRDTSAGLDIYTFCRPERGWLQRQYDGACVTLICPAGDDGSHCR